MNMVLVVGLGNPGLKYTKTRHNIGHLMIDNFGKLDGFKFIKTECFMNQAGGFVLDEIEKNGISIEDLVIIHDDWSFDVGSFRLQKGRGANRHRGIEDIIRVLGTKDFWRLRIGIGFPPVGVNPSDYVLSEFREKDLEILHELIERIKFRLLEIF